MTHLDGNTEQVQNEPRDRIKRIDQPDEQGVNN